MFLINGIPVLVIECKNASKDEAIALGIDQIRRYHEETPEVMTPEMLFKANEAQKPTILLMIDRNELLHFSVPNHGKLLKSLMRAHLGDYEILSGRLSLL